MPLQLQIPGQTKPGIYHIVLKFSSAESQNSAMACVECIQDVAVNIEVTEDIREKIATIFFCSIKKCICCSKADFSFSVENTEIRRLFQMEKSEFLIIVEKRLG